MQIHDALGPLFHSTDLQHLFSTEGRPAEDPARLALIIIMQFAEGLSDRQTAEAVRSRIDWKYALALPLDNPGFDASVLCEFRARLLHHQAEHLLFETLLEKLRAQGWLRPRGRQRTDSTHVLAVIRALNRLEGIGATMRHALNTLAVCAPQWLLAHSQPEWLERYGPRFEDYRLPESKAERQSLAEVIGRDGLWLMEALQEPETPPWLREIPAIETLRQVWIQNYTTTEQGTLRWRTGDQLPPSAEFVNSPYDQEARYSKKRSTSWVGYKVFLTESCDEDLPHLITNVETTPATTPDEAMTGSVHASLEQRDLLPGVHLVDTGFIDAELLVESSQQYEVDLFGPPRGDCKRQAREGQGFAAADFLIDWQRKKATCPAGHESISWSPALDGRSNSVIKIKFSMKHCQGCPHHARCTDGKRRGVTVRPEQQHKALQEARARQQTAEFKEQYGKRAGIEGTISQGVRVSGLRRSRYVGLAKTRLQHLMTATALNLVRVSDWLEERPHAPTRQSTFERLYLMAA